MAYWELQDALNINLDKWMINMSSEQPLKRANRCYSFEKDWIECSHGIGQTRANVECSAEYEDFYECLHKAKTAQRLAAIIKQREKLIKEGKYTPPPHHTGKVETRP
ncbi:PREDICTED: NADH dehydrogenase [ubiquinone] iron-sulfur protein 5 [Gavialis gangeticus]|uniref:NADH dehydrogenase [ubiquinone] iron-sulfur protein 5 n=1 Tax=Gavialis gangeticus TaxID=94835 RepID=UPI00092F1187|nr:PREDICTED: NADH dehydrogenase [ubiquinone] iron-sulfur protein 5 [Gavialis gangeticus]XP_019367884.1 PREDICTED: NADH dehydrogenase [ubiquinone] iron-sulfur protein 5 [Gavialis gangeticus]